MSPARYAVSSFTSLRWTHHARCYERRFEVNACDLVRKSELAERFAEVKEEGGAADRGTRAVWDAHSAMPDTRSRSIAGAIFRTLLIQ